MSVATFGSGTKRFIETARYIPRYILIENMSPYKPYIGNISKIL